VGDESLFARNSAGKVDIAPGDMDADGANASRNSLPPGAGASMSDSEVSSTAQARAAGGDAANSDRMITDAAQTQIAAATAGQGASIAVNTLNGLVILTGTAPSPAVVEQVKQVVQQIKNVQGVDATAVRISSL
jgi:osmotically-inducible protein OsmY